MFWRQRLQETLVPSSNAPPGVRFLFLPLQVTFILLLELLVASTLPQVGKNLGELADDNVICSKRGLSLKTPRSKNVIPLSRNLFTFSFTQ